MNDALRRLRRLLAPPSERVTGTAQVHPNLAVAGDQQIGDGPDGVYRGAPPLLTRAAPDGR